MCERNVLHKLYDVSYKYALVTGMSINWWTSHDSYTVAAKWRGERVPDLQARASRARAEVFYVLMNVL